MPNLTPWTRRIAFICVTTGIVAALVCRYQEVALILSGGLLTLINPKEQ